MAERPSSFARAVLFSPPESIALVAVAVLALSALQTQAQPPGAIEIRNGQPFVNGQPMNPGGGPGPQANPSEKPADKPSDDEKNDQEKKEDDGDKGDEKKPENVTRPDAPPQPPDPRELQVKPDEHGRVPFSFNGQPWPDVLQWLANVSNLSLDWQELPSGYLNLTTRRSYTLPEARDLLNRHLQARGYTLVLSGEVLSVFKLDSIDPSLIPKVDEADLYDRQPHDLVKTVFELPAGIEAAKAVEDFQKVVSKNAKLMPLPATSRVLAIDTAANLRLVSELLNQERLASEGSEIPRRFVLKHARAEKVINTLYVVLGMDPMSQPSQMELQIQMQKMQLLQQMNQNGKDVTKMLNRDGPKVYLAFNRKENSILANAEPAELKIIERTIEILDIPAAGADDSQRSDQGRYAKTYPLENVRPNSLMATLEEIGDLDPLTELRADDQADLLFVRGGQGDHERVQKIIDQLDVGGQEFEVFQLRYYPADAVAGTVMELLGAEEEDDDSNNRRRYYYYGWGGGNQDDDEDESTLRVSADVENNQLLVRGTKEELQQVRGLLTKLGELNGKRQDGGPTTRIVESLDPAATERLLEQLRAAWPAVSGGAELLLEPAPTKPTPSSPAPGQPAAEDQSADAAPAGRFRFATDQQQGAQQTQQANRGSQEPAGQPAQPPSGQPSGQPTEPAVGPAPLAVTVTPDGRIVLMSEDPAAVARAEDLLNTLAPREEQFSEFKIQHTDAWYIYLDLKDYFEDELQEEEDANPNGRYYYFYDYAPNNKDDKASTMLSKRRPLRFLYILQTNSVIVANASQQQLDTIGKLIEIWDQPPRADDIMKRRTGIVEVKHSSPTKIANALKEVYRDLLSSRDKEFQTNDEKSGSSYTTAKTTRLEFAGIESSGGPTSESKPIRVRFDGALSIGVDEVAGMLLISARTEIYDDVVRMIELLDQAAQPNNTVQVRRVSAAQVDSIQKALSSTLGKTWVGGKPEESAQQQPQQPPQNEDRGRDRRRRRDRG